MAGRKTKLGASLAGAVTMLAGCGLTPGAAVVVGSERISHDRVDDLATAVCAANVNSALASNQPPPQLPTRGARELAVQILIETELGQQLGEREGIEANQAQVSQAVAQNETGLALLEGKQQEDLRAALRDYAESQFVLVEVGRESLGSGATDDEAMAEGQRILGEYAQDLDIEVDPRYGRFEDGTFKRGGTSLSVPVSEKARAGEQAQLADGFVSQLPASQICS